MQKVALISSCFVAGLFVPIWAIAQTAAPTSSATSSRPGDRRATRNRRRITNLWSCAHFGRPRRSWRGGSSVTFAGGKHLGNLDG